MTVFANRMSTASEHEKNVCARIRSLGWQCEPFGQALLSEPMREALRRFKTPVRWMPDLIAVRDEILFVDAKSEQRRDTPNFSVECASWESDKRWSIALAAPVVYVFADFSANYIDALRPIRTISEDRGGTSGSGTAFILVRKSDQLHLEEIFGRVE